MRKTWGRSAIAAAIFLVGTGLYLYWNPGCGEKSDCEPWTNPDLAIIIVSTEDLPPNTELSARDERLMEMQIPRDLLVEGAITDPEQLDGTRTLTTIFANEQIVESRLCPPFETTGIDCFSEIISST